MNDERIVELFLSRNEQAIAEAQNRYGKYCLSIADNILADMQDAEECVNDAILAVWNSIPPNEPENLKAYVGKLTRQKAIDRWRENRAQKRVRAEFIRSLDELGDLASGINGDMIGDKAALAKAISDFLRSVRERERNVFVRRYWYCDSLNEICIRYGFGMSKVKMMLKRTRDKLSDYLKEEGFDL